MIDALSYHELQIISVALQEFIWNLEDELDAWDLYDDEYDLFNRDPQEFKDLIDQLHDTIELLEDIDLILMEEEAYV